MVGPPNIPFALPPFEPPSNPLNYPTLQGIDPLPTGFLVPDPEFPNINWVFISISTSFMKLPEMINLDTDIKNRLAQAIMEGITAFIKALIEIIIQLVIIPITIALAALLALVTFAAAIAAFIYILMAAFIVSMVGLLLGAGLISFGAAKTLGLIS